MSEPVETPPTRYPSAWRPAGAPAFDDDEELAPLELETYLAALSPYDFQSLMLRVRGLR
jgi:hypothetical protein